MSSVEQGRQLLDQLRKVVRGTEEEAPPRIDDPANDRKIDNRRLGPGVFKFTITITLQPTP